MDLRALTLEEWLELMPAYGEQQLHISWRAAQVLSGHRPDAELGTVCGLAPIGRGASLRRPGYCASEADAWDMIHMICADPHRDPELIQQDAFNQFKWPWITFCPGCQYVEESPLIILDRILVEGPPPEVNRELNPASRVKGERAIDLLWTWLKENGPQSKSAMEHFVWQRAHPGVPDLMEHTRYMDYIYSQDRWYGHALRMPYLDGLYVPPEKAIAEFYRSSAQGFRLTLVRASTGFWGANWPTYIEGGVLRPVSRGVYEAGRRPW